ncbi:hypothetical protein BEL04_02825 [Mucilaginibacter sp. PPCGB 2223]|uniref:hypothetical protein n=1 Tax=Mucilaginibacter sp. PPCGB 2223 TaxID=1886027 RepID=UPI000826D482|nr:hypothetical protein [Mucilaginibacter sp. PPCGB 2223]OCX53255.1 hypothetical protein BEL04_02825 [Mucilaginibacter sp. PPCGB 2223]
MADQITKINRDGLLKQIAGTIGKTKVLALTAILHELKFSLRDLMNITFYHEKEVAFRASWIMENLLLIDTLGFLDDVEHLAEQFLKVKNRSCQRHYLKALIHLTEPKADPIIKDKMAEIDLEPAAEHCFDLLIDTRSPIAIKVFASQLLFNLRKRYDWIGEMLAEQLHIMMNVAGGPAINSRAKTLLTQLAKDRIK